MAVIMEGNEALDRLDAKDGGKPISWSEGESLIGTTPQQTAFARGIFNGLDLTAAYRAAYKNAKAAPNTIRSSASKLARSSRVMALLQWARSGAGASETIGDVTALLKLLWKAARSPDGTRSLRAMEIIARIEQTAAANRPEETPDPARDLAEIAESSDWFALILALDHGIRDEELPAPVRLLTAADMDREFDRLRRLVAWHFSGRPTGDAALQAMCYADAPQNIDRSQWPAGKHWDGNKRRWVADASAKPKPEAQTNSDAPV